ncbi:MAG: tRNA pseudouridine(13) synthase TruD [Candidatus Thermoplasmatota archaeon]|nr:tRNA pseudouridine(13) synthase TruD [Candidatus Thermoplasmatota archaeon]
MAQPPFERNVPSIDAELGLGFYLTSTPGIGGKLRVLPEDFQVREDPASVAEAHGEGKYTLATVQARNWETHRLMREIANRLGVNERRVFFSGSKDKRAVTVQNVAIPAPLERVEQVSIPGVEILSTKRVDRAPKLGEHTGNAFTIRIREMDVPLDEAETSAREVASEILSAGGFPNFFGPQRFGSVRPVTHLVGKALVHEGPLEALWTYIAHPSELDPPRLAEPRAQLWEERDPALALEVLPERLDYERQLAGALAKHPDDPVQALDALPRNLQRMFVGAYQSYLFNLALTERAKETAPWLAEEGDLLFPAEADGTPNKDELVPVAALNAERCKHATQKGDGFTTAALPGYEDVLAAGRQGRIERSILEAEDVRPDDFRIYDAPHLSSSGTRRNMWCPIRKLDVSAGADDHGAFIELSFFLPKGSYATCLLREIMKAEITAY